MFYGIVTSGLGEGSYFMSLDYYKNEIKKKLGFDPYPGTLNIKVEEDKSTIFKNHNPIKIKDYKKNNKLHGGVICYKARIKDINGAIIIPDINKQKEDIIEFIASVNIKSELKINDGDKIAIEVLEW